MSTYSRNMLTMALATGLLFTGAARLALAAGHADAGGDVFDEECSDCHSLKAGKNKKGPSLFAAVGRRAGSVSGYQYSPALAQSGIVWTPEKLQAYIAAPRQTVPGGKMKYDGSKLRAEDIADLIAFLSTQR